MTISGSGPGNGGDPLDLDMLAATLRADAGDGDTFFEVLAAKLADALGDRVELRREGGRFRKEKRVSGITVDFAPAGPTLDAERQKTAYVCRIRRCVRGIVVSNADVSLAEWVDALVKNLSDEAERSEAARAALEGLVT
jgi:hypothetical protein